MSDEWDWVRKIEPFKLDPDKSYYIKVSDYPEYTIRDLARLIKKYEPKRDVDYLINRDDGYFDDVTYIFLDPGYSVMHLYGSHNESVFIDVNLIYIPREQFLEMTNGNKIQENDLSWLEDIEKSLEPGDRIELISMYDDPNPIPPGTKGTVLKVDNRVDTIKVDWDNGRVLNLIKNVDQYRIINEGDISTINKSMPKTTLKGSSKTPLRKKFDNSLKTKLTPDIKVENELDAIEGGKSDNLTINDISRKHNVSIDDIQKELEVGIQVEMEHTNDPLKAREISMDHISEFPDYYTNKKFGLKSNEKKLEKLHGNDLLESFFGKLSGFGGKNKDDQYNLKQLTQDLTRITDLIKTSDHKHEQSIVNMIENFREKYSEHSMLDTMVRSLYSELRDKIGGIEETTGSGSSGGFSGPLFGKKNESTVYKVKELVNEITNTWDDHTDGSEPISNKSMVDIDGDGWNFDDVPAWEGGEIIDPLAKKKTNWKDTKLSLTKENLIKTVKILNEDNLPTQTKDKKKVIKTILSSLTLDQLKTSVKLARNFIKKHDILKDTPDFNELTKVINLKKLQLEKDKPLDETTSFGSTLGDGSRSGSDGVYSTPIFAAKSNKDWKTGKKPMIPGGIIVQQIKNDGVLHESEDIIEINNIKFVKDGDYVSLKKKCTGYDNQEPCSQGSIDKPLKLSKTTTENISKLSKKIGLEEKTLQKLVLKSRKRNH